tara:strand:+ start:103 stop:525 length:423 start_codon:yes stop_codon:yes gene_type:complete
MDVIENTYPKQAKINNVQRGMFWLSLQKYDLDDCMSALLLHCETGDGEWKPQICHLCKFLKTSEDTIRVMFNDFFKRKDVKDEKAKAIYNRLGGLEMHKLSEYQTKKLEDKFVQLYLEEGSKETFAALPDKLKTKLIGNK